MQLRITGNPMHQHDCAGCVYLGTATVERPEANGREDFDLYVCPNEKPSPTVLARYGSDGPDYYSGVFASAQAFRALPNMSFAAQGGMAAAYALAKLHGWDLGSEDRLSG